jgi:hypothetical protein
MIENENLLQTTSFEENTDEILFRPCFSNKLSTSDPYDIWKTNLGIIVKSIFNKNSILGFIPASLLNFFDHFINNNTRIFYKKQEFPIVRALAAMSLLNLYKSKNKVEHLTSAKKHLDWLKENSSKGYCGYCWGANMRWASKNGIYEKDTPFITHTPYALEAFIKYQKITGNNEYQDVIKSVFEFIDKDLYKFIDTENMLCLSYAPINEPRQVINANSYALYSLSLLQPFFPEKSLSIQNNIFRIYNFIVSNQNNNGSWWYYADNKKGNFIDCFHSCFILKNLIKTSATINLPEGYSSVIENGYNYILNNFYDKNSGLFKRFSKTDKPSFVKFDLYDNAEMLNLFFLKRDVNLYSSLKKNIQKHFIKRGEIYSMVDLLNIKKNKNMLRWAVMPYLYSLSHSLNTETNTLQLQESI